MPTAVRPASSDTSSQLDALLARSGAKERATVERHLAICDAEPEPGHGKLWRRLAARLGSLVPLGIQTSGQLAVLFFVPDGKYRMQVFALEDNRDGQMHVYLPDVLTQAVRGKILAKAGEDMYGIVGHKRQVLQAHAMDAANTNEPPPHVKHMLGWNRKAVRVSLPATEADTPQVAAVEALCALAAEKWTAA